MQQSGPSWLIDAIVQQTLVLIAQLATSGGQRAPLAKLADQVFLDLAAALEAQGLSQKVIADMFGMALRSYQRKRRRLLESQTIEGASLWSSILALIHEKGRITRWALLQAFSRDDEVMIGGVLADLVASSLIYQTGYGQTTTYRPADDAFDDWTSAEAAQVAAHLVWLRIYRADGLRAEAIAEALSMELPVVHAAVEVLLAEGRIAETDAGYTSARWLIPYGSVEGWPAAVFDHFQAMVGALCAKLRAGPRSAHHDVVGGSTFTFTLAEGHPMQREVIGLMGQWRAEAQALRARLDAFNAEHPLTGPALEAVVYLGQNIISDSEPT